jgi:hypothetical protein
VTLNIDHNAGPNEVRIVCREEAPFTKGFTGE